MADNMYTTTTFSIFPDLLPPPGPEFSIPVPTNTEPTGAERWMRFQRNVEESQQMVDFIDQTETMRMRGRAARASSSSTRQRRVPARPTTRQRRVPARPSTRQRRVPATPRTARVSIDPEAEEQVKNGPIVPPETQAVQPKGRGTGTCPICMSTFDEPTTTKCGHIFCKMCIAGAFESVKKSFPSVERGLHRGTP